MKMKFLFRQASALAVAAASVVGLSCRLGPVDYGKFELRTIEENLAAIDSATTIYATQLAAGNIDAAAQEAQEFLLTQPGVDKVRIAADSTVWAFFASGLLAGLGTDDVDTVTARAVSPPEVRVQAGGEVGDGPQYILPFNVELSSTRRDADAIRGIFQRALGWGEGVMVADSEVSLGLVQSAVESGTSLLFWAGHGLLLPPDSSSADVPGIMTGTPYDRRGAAEAAASRFAGYANPGASRRQIAVFQRGRTRKYHLVIMPEFIRAHADFDLNEAEPQNATKTIVYLSCCYSAYSTGGTGALMQAFLDAGADVVSGWTWAVGARFACDKDTMFFKAMADTCLPGEAYSSLGSVTEPVPRRGGLHARLAMYGDTLVLLQTVLRVEKNGTLFRSSAGAQAKMFGSHVTEVSVWERQDASPDEAAHVTFLFPSTSPGSFDLSTSGAFIKWEDIATGRTYWAQSGYVGTSGILNIDQCAGDVVIGHFNATLGWWEAGKNPYNDPPTDTISLKDGVLKYTGKIAHYDPSPTLAGG